MTNKPTPAEQISELIDMMNVYVNTLDDLINALDSKDCEIRKLRGAILAHRGARDFMGGKSSCDERLWEHIADIPWGPPIGSRFD